MQQEHSETLNLRQIREYSPTREDVEMPEGENIESERAVNTHNYPSYFLLRTSLLALVALAMVVGYVGSGFLRGAISQQAPMSFIAGVSVYNR